MVEVILLENMIFSDRRYRAGETIVMSEEMAKNLIEQDLAMPVPLVNQTVSAGDLPTEPAKKPARRVTKKATQS